MLYDPELIQSAIAGRAKTAKICRQVAKLYSPMTLPDAVYQRVCTRKKLALFLQAFGIDTKAIMHQYDLSVPKDLTLTDRSKPLRAERIEMKEEDFIF